MPAALDTFVNPINSDTLDSASVPHAAQHSNLNDATKAIERIVVGPTWYNAKGHGGAAGNDAADDTAALQSVVNTAAGNKLYIPPGIYRINTKTAAPSGGLAYGLSIPSNTTIIADNATIKQTFSDSGAGLNTLLQNASISAGNSNIKIQGLTLSLPAFAGTLPNLSSFGFGINFNGCSGVRLFDNDFGNAMLQAKPISSQVNSSTAHANGLNTKWILSRNTWNGAAEALAFYQGTALEFLNNIVLNCYDSSFSVNSSGEDIVIMGNTFDKQSNAWAALAHIELTNDYAGDTNGIRDVTIVGNTCINGAYANCKGIQLGRSTDVTIVGNTVRNMGFHGIYAGDSCTDVTIVGNTAKSNGGAGIQLANDGAGTGLSDITISANTVRSNAAGGIMSGGGSVTMTAIDITGNTSRSNTGGAGIGTGANVTTATGNISNNVISGNTGAPGNAQVYGTGTGWTVRNNPGWNPQGAVAVTVTASPFTYTAGNTPEVLSIDAGTVSSIAKNSQTLYTSTGKSVPLEPHEAVIITYSGLPTVKADQK